MQVPEGEGDAALPLLHHRLVDVSGGSVGVERAADEVEEVEGAFNVSGWGGGGWRDSRVLISRTALLHCCVVTSLHFQFCQYCVVS